MDAIQTEIGTHVVVGLSWVANSVLSCSYENRENHDSREIHGMLKAHLKKAAFSISGQASVDFKEGENSIANKFEIQIYGDILPSGEKLPTTIEGVIELMKKVPKLISGSNQGKGKPITYRLIPISLLKRYLNFGIGAHVTLRNLEESSLQRVVKLFEDITTSQAKLHDLHQEMLVNFFCVEMAEMEKVYDIKNKMEVEETSLRSNLADTLIKVRSGALEMDALENLICSFQNSNLSPTNILKMIDTWQDIVEKINVAKSITQKGGIYIGFRSNLDNEPLKDLNEEAFVLFFDRLSKTQNSQKWSKNRQLFIQELNKSPPFRKIYAVDCDIHKNYMPVNKSSCIQIFKNGECLSEDYLEDLEKEQATPLCRSSEGSEKRIHMPPNRVALKIPCAGRNCDAKLAHEWKCKTCRNPMEWGFDNFGYCKCGRVPAISLEFKCPRPRHGLSFETYERNYLELLLSNLRPREEINILILGETGVGKSTWINALVNFCHYETLEEAENHNLLSVIPTSFSLHDENMKAIEVKTGSDNNEVLKKGQSATQSSKVYTISAGDVNINLMDTPGIGDTRGVDQDKLNFKDIMDTLGYLKELHGICILLKPNDSRLTLMIRFCIQELLSHLHADAAQNIVFCFTNSRATMYKPGDTLPTLRTLLEEKVQVGVNIPLTKHTIYCFDSEAYRYLAAVKNNPPVEFSDVDRDIFSTSWKRSISENRRMFDHFKTLKPHVITSTINLNHARQMILELTPILADISHTTHKNKTIVEGERKEILQAENTIKALKKKLMVTRIVPEVKELDYPRTVCADSNCSTVCTIDGTTTVEYKQICHDRCQLGQHVKANTLGDLALLRCWAIEGNNCKHKTCGHSYLKHLHIYYELLKVPTTVEDPDIKSLLSKNLNAKDLKQGIINAKDKEIREYEEELKKIEKALAKFACFLKANSITPYNDSLKEYLQHLIEEERDLLSRGKTNRETLKSLEKSLRNYEKEREILENALKTKTKDVQKAKLSPQKMQKIVKDLKSLKRSGESIQKAQNALRHTAIGMKASVFVPVNTPAKSKQSNCSLM